MVVYYIYYTMYNIWYIIYIQYIIDSVIYIIYSLVPCPSAGFNVQNEAALEKLFEASNCDIRHTINALQTWRLKTDQLEYNSVAGEVAGGGKNQSVMQASVFDVFSEWCAPSIRNLTPET